LLAGAVRDRAGRRGAIKQTELALCSVAPDPLARTAHANRGGRGRLGQRPTLLNHATAKLPAPFQTERSVSVKVHPVSSLDWGAWQLPASKGTRMDQRTQELQLGAAR